MVAPARLIRRLGTACCAVALLAQATALPLLHGQHGIAASLERALTATRHDAAPSAPELHGSASAPHHDAAACVVCATLARAGSGIIGSAARASLPEPLTTAVRAAEQAPPAAPLFCGGAPRAPPALVS